MEYPECFILVCAFVPHGYFISQEAFVHLFEKI